MANDEALERLQADVAELRRDVAAVLTELAQERAARARWSRVAYVLGGAMAGALMEVARGLSDNLPAIAASFGG